MRNKWLSRSLLFLAIPILMASPTYAQKPLFSFPFFNTGKSGEQPSRYQPNQVCPPRPKYDFTEDGRPILTKRYPAQNTHNVLHFRKYPYYENVHGVEHVMRGKRLKRQPDEVLSEEQKAILREWGQPDYLRGPYKSTRGELVVEWVYHRLNHLFQFVDRTMVYEGPLTDQERTILVYGLPSEVIATTIAPNIRRETWLYRSPFKSAKEMVFSFANGKLVFEDEAYSY
ncbi:MAG: hypothetical protein N2644_05815 [Candidatus Sumerlaea chitinivorans]|uniref:Lipoprotein n=1 Tax=Sumerlaea chitinivorans TaxID=2250252 RepID=A0A2Z4Y403_SUMC1|nr:hypothetical protein BRCON_1087 [Candidatus Sumerlaea chitinivorans]MCX7963981.1 hypothetical protein [Candidatus Sumerlaea chitinivorans]